MAEHVLDDLHFHAGSEGQRGGTVSEIMKPDRRQFASGDESIEVVREPVGADPRAFSSGEYPASVDPRWSGFDSLAMLMRSVCPDDAGGLSVERDDAIAGFTLGHALRNLRPVGG